jgi:hydrogenase-4 membrane subunit HyfE
MVAMSIDFKKNQEEREQIKIETRTPRALATAMLLSTALLALMAFVIKIDFRIKHGLRENIYWALIFVIILILIVILSVRKTIYYSSRFIKDDDSLVQILKKWKKIDIFLLIIGEVIPILGLIITWLGMPFERTGFIFLVSAILMVILMPVGIKVRGKLDILRKHHDGI